MILDPVEKDLFELELKYWDIPFEPVPQELEPATQLVDEIKTRRSSEEPAMEITALSSHSIDDDDFSNPIFHAQNMFDQPPKFVSEACLKTWISLGPIDIRDYI